MKYINIVWAGFMLFAICYLFTSTIADAISNKKCKQCKKRGREANEIN